MAKAFTRLEENILALAGGNLSESATPFLDIAERCGTDERTVLDLLRRMKADKSLRRFGATLRHQKAGYGHNAMVAWAVPEEDAERVGEIMADQAEVSHCYRRRIYPEWRYNLYTMIHGKEPNEFLGVVERIMAETGQSDYCVLRSLKELKKTSMVYFRFEPGTDARKGEA